jgi:hypothetical protein
MGVPSTITPLRASPAIPAPRRPGHGPVFFAQDTKQIVAVTAVGISNAGCRGDGSYYRTDRQAVIDSIIGHAGDDAHLIRVG